MRNTQSIFALSGFLLIALLVPMIVSEYWIHVIIIAYFYALLSTSWTLLAGYAGQFSFAHMAFCAIGAYTSGFLSLYTSIPICINIILGGMMAVFFGVFIGKLVLKIRGPYLALFTIAFAELLRIAITAEHKITRGDFGLEVPALFSGISKSPYYYTMLGILVISVFIMWIIINSDAGLYFRSIRENEDAASSLGVNFIRYKIIAFSISSFFAGIAGAFYGHYVLVLSPNMVRISEMGIVIAMSVIGGIESLAGAFAGALIVEFISEYLRDYGEWRLVIFGLLLIITLRFAKNGLIYPLLRVFKSKERHPS